jgi:uncharacterized protein (DUF934 family)
MAALIRNRQIVPNPPSPEDGPVLLIEPSQPVEEVAEKIPGAARIEVNFPRFGDGRGFSTAKLLRERYGYTGELRAVGHVVRDHLAPLEAVGFDAFLLKEGEDAEAALAAFSDFPIFRPRRPGAAGRS